MAPQAIYTPNRHGRAVSLVKLPRAKSWPVCRRQNDAPANVHASLSLS